MKTINGNMFVLKAIISNFNQNIKCWLIFIIQTFFGKTFGQNFVSDTPFYLLIWNIGGGSDK